MRDAKDDIEGLGGRLVIVGNGQPYQAKGFAETHGMAGHIFTDPERHLYAAAGMRRGVGTTFSLGTVKAGARAFGRGFRQTRTQGDPWQQGGTLVIRPSGEIVYEHISEAAGDHAPVEDVLAALRAAAGAAG